MDTIAQYKAGQRQLWSQFAPLEVITTVPAARLVRHARIPHGARVLDVACGTGVVSVTAARAGASVTGLDLTPELLARAREHAALADLPIDFHEGDVEQLPFGDATFDVVLSQYGHMFAPRPDVAIGEMLRVLKPGGTLAFSTWPPEMFVGRMFLLVASYLPPLPAGVMAPPLWGHPDVVRQRLGVHATDVVFARDHVAVPALSPRHQLANAERVTPPVMRVVAHLSEHAPERLAAFRREYEDLVSEYFGDNAVRQDYLMTRARKR